MVACPCLDRTLDGPSGCILRQHGAVRHGAVASGGGKLAVASPKLALSRSPMASWRHFATTIWLLLILLLLRSSLPNPQCSRTSDLLTVALFANPPTSVVLEVGLKLRRCYIYIWIMCSIYNLKCCSCKSQLVWGIHIGTVIHVWVVGGGGDNLVVSRSGVLPWKSWGNNEKVECSDAIVNKFILAYKKICIINWFENFEY